MRIIHARWTLFLIFFIFFVIAFLSIVHTYREGMIFPESMNEILLKLLAIYSIPLSLIIGGLLAQKKSQSKSVSTGVSSVAFLLILLWNFLVTWRVISFAFLENDTVSMLNSYLDKIVPATCFLIVGFLSYFFSKHQ